MKTLYRREMDLEVFLKFASYYVQKNVNLIIVKTVFSLFMKQPFCLVSGPRFANRPKVVSSLTEVPKDDKRPL